MTAPSRPGGFEGDLAALSVVEIVQTLNLSGRTARLHLRSISGTGMMWFRDGVMTHATAGTLYGDLAVYTMVEWTTGRFLVEYGLSSESRSIASDTTHMLLEALRRIDERSSSPRSEGEPLEAPPVLESDARRTRSRGLAVAVTAFALVAGAIGAAVLLDGRSTTSTGAVAAVLAPEPPALRPASHPAPTTPAPAPARRPRPKTEAVARTVPVAVPEAPPVPEPVVAALPEPEPSPTPPPIAAAVAPVPSRIKISGKSRAGGGTLRVLVDGEAVFTRDRLDDGEPFEAEIAVPPGEHEIVARMEGGRKAGVHEDSARGKFVEGETRLLRVSANRILGSPVKIKLDGQTPAAGAAPSAVQQGSDL